MVVTEPLNSVQCCEAGGRLANVVLLALADLLLKVCVQFRIFRLIHHHERCFIGVFFYIGGYNPYLLGGKQVFSIRMIEYQNLAFL